MGRILVVFVFAALAAEAAAQAAPAPGGQPPDQFLGARYRAWRAELDGELRVSDNAIPGTDIDIDRTLNLDQIEDIDNFGLWIGAPNAGRLCVDYWWGTYEGDEVLTSSVTYSGTTFAVGEDVHTELEWRCLTVVYEYDFRIPLGSDLLEIRFGPRAGVKWLRIRGELESALADESRTVRIPAPVLGGAAELYVGQYLSAGIEVDGMRVSAFDGQFNGRLYDVTLALRGGYGGGFVGAGYRQFGIRLKGEDVGADEVEVGFTFSGYFVEVGFRF